MIHLHLHTEYSLRDSTIKISDLVNAIQEPIAITDHGNVGGWIEYLLVAKQKPILGIEFYICDDIGKRDKGEELNHLVVLAKNRAGYQNILKLTSLSYVEGFYYKPRVDLVLLKKYSEGLIFLTGCVGSVLYMRGLDYVESVYRELVDIAETYLEIMCHNFHRQKRHNFLLSNLGGQLVITQDVHYLRREDYQVHDILMQMQGRLPYTEKTYYLASRDEIYNDFCKYHEYIEKGQIWEGIDNAYKIVESIEDYGIEFGKYKFPEYRE